MSCERRGNTIVCSRGSRKSLGRCVFCGHREAEVLCDGPVQTKTTLWTCDAAMCRACAKHEEPDRDFCPAHDAPEKRRLAL